MRNELPSATSLAALLARDCEKLFRELVPDAHFETGEARGHASDGGVISMALRGPKRGRWSNWNSENQSGDPLDLVAWMLFGGDLRQAYAWACHRLGITRWTTPSVAPAAQEAHHARCSATSADQARALYLRGVQGGSEVLSYLSGRLGGPLDQLLPEIPQGLRFVGAKRHPHSHDLLPAMLAPVLHPLSRAYLATHVTFLEPRENAWRKARVQPAKICIGSYRGGVIPLLRGASGMPLRDAPIGETLLIGEGVENALAAAVLRDDRPRVWAAVAAGNLPNIVLPKQITRVILVEDCDEGNEAITRMLARAKQSFLDAGLAVEWMRAPKNFKDMAEFVSTEFRLALAAAE
jgi:hypothetical protein